MKIPRSPAPLVDLFGKLLAETGGEGRIMFGCPSAFLRGNLFMGLFGSKLFVRLAEAERMKLLAVEGTEIFDPMGGRPMREYVVVPAGWLEGDADDELRTWARQAARYGATLPPKGATKKAAKKPPARKKPDRASRRA
jgi:hypothetical protein